jgi:hypothetical protein
MRLALSTIYVCGETTEEFSFVQRFQCSRENLFLTKAAQHNQTVEATIVIKHPQKVLSTLENCVQNPTKNKTLGMKFSLFVLSIIIS